MTPIQAALYARVSSAQQAEAHTVASQVAALRERIAAEGLSVPEALQCIDEGYSGATLVRPALERLRDLAAAGAVDRLYVHSPDRLARKYAYQVLLVDEFQRAGVEVIFLNRELGRSPEDDLLLQVQGMMAEYERAKIIERHRRGKRHAARAGSVNVLSGAPYGYRYVPKHASGGQARYDMVPEEARVVRQVFAWVGRDRLTIGEVCRRLTCASEVTHTGKTVWDRSAVWGMLKNPAYMGAAAFGKTRQGLLRPRLRAQRRRPVQPRRAVSSYDVPPEEWLRIPVPAIVEPELFAAVQEQLRENQRYARQSRRGALYLLQGLVQCQHCGYAFYGKRLSPSARKGKPRTYAYYRCLGTDAYRFGGERICQNTQVRTDLLELAVWREVCALLAHPERLAEEYRRRLQPDTRAQRMTLATLEAHLGKLRQGLARLIDSYADGLIEKHEFEPRVTRLRQRIAHVEAQGREVAEEAALHTDLQLIIGRLEEFATRVYAGLEEADWTSKRELIRTMVKRVEVARDQVNVIFRVEPRPGDPTSEKKSLQDCRGSNHATLRHATPCPLPPPVDDYPGPQPLRDQLQHPAIADTPPDKAHQHLVVHTVEEALNVGLEDPPAPDQRLLDRQHRLPRAALGPIPVRARQKVRLEPRLDDDFARRLDDPIANGRDPQRARATIGLGDLHPQHGAGAIPLRLQVLGELAEVGLDPVALDVLQTHAIDARAPPVRSHFHPGPPQHVGPDDAVVQRVEPPGSTPLGRTVQSALEFS